MLITFCIATSLMITATCILYSDFRFVGPFFNAVQNWEKSLSHISEVLDVSFKAFYLS